MTIQVKGELALVIKDAKGNESTAYLDIAYTQYLREPKEARRVLEIYVQSFFETKAISDKIDRSIIVPIIKDRAWLEEMRESVKYRNGEALVESVYEDYNQYLIEAVENPGKS